MKELLVLICIGLFSLAGHSQEVLPSYLIRFTDKDHTPYSITQPSSFLSERAIARRERQGIQIDQTDLPVDPDYVEQIDAIDGVEVRYSTKWLNGVVVVVTDSFALDEIAQLDFVLGSYHIRMMGSEGEKDLLPFVERRADPLPLSVENNIYGSSFGQIAIHRGELLHEAGFTGEGMQIALLDAGFTAVDALPAFEKLRSEGRILGTRDFVGDDDYVFEGSQHGTLVLSTIAAYMPDSIIGTAPNASFWLLRTEDSASESPVEELNWIAGAEFADSVGVDILSTSLGYSLFNDSTMNYSPEQMDGTVTWISRGANMASQKGLLVLNSAGNSGASPWRSITAPADADGILAIGAVNNDGVKAPFSGFGPSSDGRVKPEVMAVGWQTTFADLAGGISQGNGTSFSCPIMAGLCACLWQAHPDRSAEEIREAVIRSAHLFYHPNDSLGHGIPDLWTAHRMLSENQVSNEGLQVQVYPNPFSQYLTVVLDQINIEELELSVVDLLGREVYLPGEFLSSGETHVRTIDLSFLSKGMYYLVVRNGEQRVAVAVQRVE